jgi:UDP-glucose 4-epimerase
MPLIARVAAGELPKLEVYGGDYPTDDGTGVRDYIHVLDLAEGHVAALERHFDESGVFTYNLGTGSGTSVLQLIATYEDVSGRPVPYEVVDRRPGDVAANWADPAKAKRVLGWHTTRDLSQMCEDSWRWQQGAR